MNIKKASEMFDLSVDTLRYYEDDHIAKFKAGEITPDQVEKLWERKK